MLSSRTKRSWPRLSRSILWRTFRLPMLKSVPMENLCRFECMVLFFDTETTGKYEFGLPPDDHRQPHIVQLAALLSDDSGKEIASMNAIIRPDGFIIPPEA